MRVIATINKLSFCPVCNKETPSLVKTKSGKCYEVVVITCKVCKDIH